MYFSARNSVERLQGVYFLINVILIDLHEVKNINIVSQNGQLAVQERKTKIKEQNKIPAHVNTV